LIQGEHYYAQLFFVLFFTLDRAQDQIFILFVTLLKKKKKKKKKKVVGVLECTQSIHIVF